MSDSMTTTSDIATRPAVQLIGDVHHPDFREAIELLRNDAELTPSASTAPELIVLAQSRPGTVGHREVERLQRNSPLAGIVALLGSWCEGETRTGRPWPGVERLYWYEFPSWWRRQMAFRAEGRCPDWARWGDSRFRIADCGFRIASRTNRGLVIVRVARRETADVLADVLQRAGYATAWERPGFSTPVIRGATAGIWEGGQLNEFEAGDLAAFCQRLARDAAPVITLFDFPRRDGVERALEIGAAAVLGKPWLNSALIETLQSVVEKEKFLRAA